MSKSPDTKLNLQISKYMQGNTQKQGENKHKSTEALIEFRGTCDTELCPVCKAPGWTQMGPSTLQGQNVQWVISKERGETDSEEEHQAEEEEEDEEDEEEKDPKQKVSCVP